MNNEITIKDGITLVDVAKNPGNYPAELKAVSLETIKMLKSQLRDMEISISSSVIQELVTDHATKLIFLGVDGSEKTLTLKTAPKKLNSSIRNYEEFLTSKGFPNLLETKIVPLGWAACKEIRKQGSAIQEVIDQLYVEGIPTVEIK